MSPKVNRFLRYTGVNLAATIVDYIVFLTLTDLFGVPIVQSIISYSIASTVNYWLSKRHVFVHDMSHKSEHRLFMEFLGTGVLGLALTAAVIWVTIHVMQLTPFEGKTISVVICFIVLYFVRSRLVFSENPNAPQASAGA
jgi:putative flippase GtrA